MARSWYSDHGPEDDGPPTDLEWYGADGTAPRTAAALLLLRPRDMGRLQECRRRAEALRLEKGLGFARISADPANVLDWEVRPEIRKQFWEDAERSFAQLDNQLYNELYNELLGGLTGPPAH